MASRSDRRSLGALGIAVLALLVERPMHPYEMFQTLLQRGEDRLLKVRPGSLYHTVDRLAHAGLVHAAGTDREGNRPERTTYEITVAGRGALSDRIAEILGTPDREYPLFPVALAEAHNLPADDVVGLLRKRIAAREADIAELDRVRGSRTDRGSAAGVLVRDRVPASARRRRAGVARPSWWARSTPARCRGWPNTSTACTDTPKTSPERRTEHDDRTQPVAALWALCIGFFMILVDTTIVSVANPAIMAALHTDLNTVVWVTSAYLLAYAVPLLITGRLGDRFGPKNIYLVGLTVFTLASLWCGLSGTSRCSSSPARCRASAPR